MIALSHVTHTFHTPARSVTALHDVTLNVAQGEFVAVVGRSGSGKTTLIYLIAGLDRPSAGRVTVNGASLRDLDENGLALWRRRNVGIVFQFFQLLPTLTLLENVLLPMELGEALPWPARRERAQHLLDAVGLADRADAFPAEISGGQQQRVAIARALANDPPLLLADEPTGNLDSITGEGILDLFEQFVQQGRTLLIVTHDRACAGRAQRVINLADGRIQDANPA